MTLNQLNARFLAQPNGAAHTFSPDVQSSDGNAAAPMLVADGERTRAESMRHAGEGETDIKRLFSIYEQKLADLPPCAERNFSQAYARLPEIYVENPPFLNRRMLSALDKHVMSSPFSVSNDTEMPAISGVETLRDYYQQRFPALSQSKLNDLAEEGFAFYTMRQLAKKGRQLDGSTLDGKTNQIADTSDEVLALRKFAGDAVVSHPLKAQIKADGQDFGAFYDQILENLERSEGFSCTQPCTVRVMHPSKSPQVTGYTINYFSQCFSAHLTAQLNAVAQQRQAQDPQAPRVNFVNDGHITTLCRTSRAEATPIGRLGQLGYFSAQCVKPGEFIVIADDHAQSGDAWMTALMAAKKGGAQTVGLAAFSIHPFSQNGLIDVKIQAKALAKLNQVDPDGQVLEALADIGITPDTLTNFEALILMAVFTAPDDELGLKAYHELVNQLSGDAHILTSAFDSLDPVLQEAVPTPAEFVVKLSQEIATNRKVVEGVDARSQAPIQTPSQAQALEQSHR